MSDLNMSRRQFLQTTSVAGIATYIATLGSPAWAALFEQKLLTPMPWDPATGKARFRVDGIAKVTGSKIFARDIRARDLPNWPDAQSHAFMLRTTRADAVYSGFDLSRLGDDLQPNQVITAKELERDELAFSEFYGDDMLLPEGKTPAYLGHPVAILIFDDFLRFRQAKNALMFQKDVISYGDKTGPLQRDPWGVFRYVRVGGKDAYAEDVFSSLKDAPVLPSQMRKRLPVWPDGNNHGDLDHEGMYHAQQIRTELDAPPSDWLVLNRQYQTQSTDSAALEPDNANCWFDASNQTLHMVVPTQSPVDVAQTAATMLAASSFKAQRLVMHPCYTVGYGSKDHNNMPFYGLVCALYSDGKPVRIANDRYEHFQSALKRHAFDMDFQIGVDKTTGKIQSCAVDMVANGGGRANLSASVAMVGATAFQSIYYLPKSDVTARADASHAVDAGSARGYGTLQSMAATEMLIDELAQELDLDPIEFRLRNVFKSGMKNTQGAIAAGAIRANEVLEKAQSHPIWSEREKRKKSWEASNPGKHYGVGFACVQKDFGTGAESSFAKVEISPQGRILLRHSGTEIGTGMSTSQALACVRWLGSPADDIGVALTDWPDLPMATSGDPFTMSQAQQDSLSADPLWTPAFASPSSASNSAFYFTHTTQEAARLVFIHGLWPAALNIWSRGTGGGQAAPYVVRREDARWENGMLTASGMQPLSLSQLASKVHELGLVAGAVVHGFNRWQWAEADFRINDQSDRLPLDGVALYYPKHSNHAAANPNDTRKSMPPKVTTIDAGPDDSLGTKSTTSGHYQVIRRTQVHYPPVQRNNAAVTYYSAAGTLVEVAIDPSSGTIELLNHHSILECGNMLSPELVSSQMQGGLAMGIGYALHEELPLYEDGPGNGTWNFSQYRVPLAQDVAVWSQTSEVLPPLSKTDPPKGMAEVVMIPVVAAIANGVAHATGKRFRSLPIKPEQVQEALK